VRFLEKTPDGGPQSNVDAFFLIEVKSLFTVALLRFNAVEAPERFHTHAFNALTWWLWGSAYEESNPVQRGCGHIIDHREYGRSILPKVTPRDLMHRVVPRTTSWALTIRGPWRKRWKELRGPELREVTLTHGRTEIFE